MKTKQYMLYVLIYLILILLFAHTRDALGDVNNDSIIDILDIVRTVNIILENDPPPTEYELWAADVNFDADINIQDIIVIITVILGTINQCPEQQSPCSYNLMECCYDTTARFTTFVIDTFGIYPSTLRDVTIVDENNIWAVDDINMPGEDRNAVHWNGEDWELLVISLPPYYPPTELHSIFALAADDIWVGVNIPLHYDGIEWRGYFAEDGWEDDWNFDGFISAIWGSSSDNVYFLGNNGSIAHYDGETFEYTPYDTYVDLLDIQGTPDGEHVFIVGYDLTGANIVLEFENGFWNEIYYNLHYFPTDSTYGRAMAVDAFSDTAYIATIAGLWKYNYINDTSVLVPAEDFGNSDNYFLDLTVQSPNDILHFGCHTTYTHYNGVSWDYNDDIIQDFAEGSAWVYGGDMKGNILVSVGYCYSGTHAVTILGYRANNRLITNRITGGR